MMELGAVVCTPRGARCGVCPLQRKCRALAMGVVDRIPRTRDRAARKKLFCAAVVVEDAKGRVLVERRGDGGMWGGLWQAPTLEGTRRATAEAIAEWIGSDGLTRVERFAHATTHREVEFEVWRCRTRPRLPGAAWKSRSQVAGLALSNAQRRVLLGVAEGRGGEVGLAERGPPRVHKEPALTTQAASVMPDWLAGLPRQDGYVCISDSRRFAHDEAKYDEQYASDPANMKVGRGLVALLRETDADFSAPALEVGCGTGLLSLGLAAESPYPLTILTDPSPAFLKITEDKVRKEGINPERLCFAVLKGEEVDRLPARSLSLIVLRSTLHHILHVDEFIANAARALKPGGVLTFEEPCLEGYILMGAMLQFLPVAAKAAGKPLTEKQEQDVDLFVRTMAFYARRDLDKTRAEDKHLFRVDELMNTGTGCGLTVEFKPNRAYESFLDPAPTPPSWGQVFLERMRSLVKRGVDVEVEERRREGLAWYRRFMRSYAKYCMSWDDGLVAAFDEFMPPYCEFVQNASMGTYGPYLHGVFVCRKA